MWRRCEDVLPIISSAEDTAEATLVDIGAIAGEKSRMVLSYATRAENIARGVPPDWRASEDECRGSSFDSPVTRCRISRRRAPVPARY